MVDLYEKIVNILGTPPNGYEWVIYFIGVLMLLEFFKYITYLFTYIFKWIGGLK